MIEDHTITNQENYYLNPKNIEIAIGDKVLLRYEVGNELDATYTAPYQVESIFSVP